MSTLPLEISNAWRRAATVLVVDDEPSVMRIHARVLETAGHLCHGANSIDSALETLERESIEVALIDIKMPGADGLALARTLQRDYPDVVVIMVTGTTDFSSVSNARLAGAVDYLVKPVTAANLLAALDRALTLRDRRAARNTRLRLAAELKSSAPIEATRSLSQPAVLAAPMRVETPIGPPIEQLFHAMIASGASDLHLSVSMPPLIRKDGEMMPLDQGAAPLSADDVLRLLQPIVPPRNRQQFEARRDSDFAYEIEGLSRFRGNIFMDHKGVAAVFRVVPNRIRTAEELGLPSSILELCERRKGLVLVTGPTGSGKSTTLAAMIDYINRTRTDHIVTIEDPIEFVHANERCLINQREVHSHTRSFKTALRAALREDPDVVLIGEMRDLQTVSIALETAETGHLVFGTLHTGTAASAVDRIIDQFPASRQAQTRVMLSESLQGVIAQTLCRRVGGGRVAALEVLLVNTAIGNLIREAKTFQIPALMQVGKATGMVTLNDALLDLVRSGTITADEGMKKAIDKTPFSVMLARPSGSSAAQPARRT